MATKKPTKIIHKNWLKYIIIGAVVILFVPVFALVGYQKYLDKKDVERFSTLQSDFKKLQTEFNTIDPGWEYSEGCTAGGKLDDFKTCSVGIFNNRISSQKEARTVTDQYVTVIQRTINMRKAEQGEYSHSNKNYMETVFKDSRVGDGICNMNVAKDMSTGTVSVSVGCRNSANTFHFNRTDR